MNRNALWGWIAFLMILFLFPTRAYAIDYSFPIGSAIVHSEIESAFDSVLAVERTTHSKLYVKNEDQIIPPIGGAVNLMAAYVAVQEIDVEKEIFISDHILSLSPSVRQFGLQPGDRWLAKDLIAAMLLYGAQDAALVLSEDIGGSRDSFVEMMNRYAASLGMGKTVYKNPLGAHAEGQQSTVSDLLMLSEAVLENDFLHNVLAQATYRAENGQIIRNRMEIMQERSDIFDKRVEGLGEGSTLSTGANVLLYAVDEEKQFLIVCHTELDDKELCEKNTKQLLNFLIQAYRPMDVSSHAAQLLQKQSLALENGTIIKFALEKGTYLSFVETSMYDKVVGSLDSWALGEFPPIATSVKEGDDVGSISLLYKGQEVHHLPINVASILTNTESTPASDPVTQDDKELEIPVFTAQDWKGSEREQSGLGSYGALIIILATASLSGMLLWAAHYLRRRKRW